MTVPRMTTRRWMLAVAATAVCATGTIAVRRSLFYSRCAAFHREKEKISLAYAKDPTADRLLCGTNFVGVPMLDTDPCGQPVRPHRTRSAADHLADAAFHRLMRQCYTNAARRPWLSVPPGVDRRGGRG